MTVLGPDDPNQKPLGWVVHERNGIEVHKYDEAREYERDAEGRWKGLEPITEEGALRAGDKILVHGLFGELFIMTVEADEAGGLCGRCDQLLALLEYGKDDRRAWVCTGLVNLRGVERLKLSSSE